MEALPPAGAGWAASTLSAALLRAMVKKGMLGREEARAIIDDALLELEKMREAVPPEDQRSVDLARALLEGVLSAYPSGSDR